MKRRTFLTAAGTIGAVSIASSATVVSSVYNSLSSQILLEEFDAISKTAVDKFIVDFNENSKSLNINLNIAKRLVMPVQVLSKNKLEIIYKNASGKTISITNKNGTGELRFLTIA